MTQKTKKELSEIAKIKKFKIDSITVNPLPVDHSIPGVHAFILDTSVGTIANTADLRFHGRRSKDTEKFAKHLNYLVF